jgi:hypothetical protein
MAGIFVSYRVADSGPYAGRLADSLKARLDPPDVFRSGDDLHAGAEWRDEIQKQLSGSQIVLAVIGPQWTTVRDRGGERRLDDADDVVRQELRESLRQGTPVVPVLVGGATLPAASDLPDDVKGVLDRNAVSVRDDHWTSDVSALVNDVIRVAPAFKVRKAGGLLASRRHMAAVLFASLTLVSVAHWLLVRFDVFRADSLRLVPAILLAVVAVLLLAHVVTRRKAL